MCFSKTYPEINDRHPESLLLINIDHIGKVDTGGRQEAAFAGKF